LTRNSNVQSVATFVGPAVSPGSVIKSQFSFHLGGRLFIAHPATILFLSRSFWPSLQLLFFRQGDFPMKRNGQAAVGALPEVVGSWVLMTGFLVTAAIVTLVPFVLL
jgi:hypothetical protein